MAALSPLALVQLAVVALLCMLLGLHLWQAAKEQRTDASKQRAALTHSLKQVCRQCFWKSHCSLWLY
jgi:hypothetical protein